MYDIKKEKRFFFLLLKSSKFYENFIFYSQKLPKLPFMFTVELLPAPGPGAYSPENAPPLNAHHRPPSYTIGARTRYRAVDAVPAPNR